MGKPSPMPGSEEKKGGALLLLMLDSCVQTNTKGRSVIGLLLGDGTGVVNRMITLFFPQRKRGPSDRDSQTIHVP